MGGLVALKIYSTCPQSKDVSPEDYLEAVRMTARWSEQAGCTGMLVYTDNGIVDPWLVAQVVLEATERLAPLVAVQPIYLHPYSVAKMVTSLAYLHGRAVHLNMLAGGFRNDLLALGDPTPHDERYARTIEYTQIVMGLLRGEAPVTRQGGYYAVADLALRPPLPPDLLPEVLISGSSPAGRAAAATLGAVPVRYPEPPAVDGADVEDLSGGVRVGIIARPEAEEAWLVADERFPEDRRGQVTHRVATATSDSYWHHQLSVREGTTSEAAAGDEADPYWLGPFQNYQTFCPYLVGSYERVASVVSRYLDQGAEVFVLDIPPSAEELAHAGKVFERARSVARR